MQHFFTRATKLGRVLLVEGSAELRSSLSEYLRSRGIDSYTAYGVTDARPLLTALNPDVTILDLDLEDGDAFDLIDDIAKVGSRCLILTARDRAEDLIRGLSSGADDFVAKPIEIEEVYLRICNILANRRLQSAGANADIVIDLQGIKVNLVTRTLLGSGDAPGADLTETELSLLRILTENIGRVVSKEVLFESVHGRPSTSRTRSLGVSISRLRIKLKSIDVDTEIRSVRQAGYILSRASELEQTRSDA
jgi:two-component system, OmpR family, response regulator